MTLFYLPHQSRVSLVLLVVAARGLCLVSSFGCVGSAAVLCSRRGGGFAPAARPLGRPLEPLLPRRGWTAAAGRRAETAVVMQIHPEGGQSPCNIKVSHHKSARWILKSSLGHWSCSISDAAERLLSPATARGSCFCCCMECSNGIPWRATTMTCCLTFGCSLFFSILYGKDGIAG